MRVVKPMSQDDLGKLITWLRTQSMRTNAQLAAVSLMTCCHVSMEVSTSLVRRCRLIGSSRRSTELL